MNPKSLSDLLSNFSSSSGIRFKLLNSIRFRDVSHPPTHITNPVGQIILVKKGILDLGTFSPTFYIPLSELVCLENPLAKGLDILAGSAEVEVPDVEAGDDYQVIGM